MDQTAVLNERGLIAFARALGAATFGGNVSSAEAALLATAEAPSPARPLDRAVEDRIEEVPKCERR